MRVGQRQSRECGREELTFSCACWERAGVDKKVLSVVEQTHSWTFTQLFMIVKRGVSSDLKCPSPNMGAAVGKKKVRKGGVQAQSGETYQSKPILNISTSSGTTSPALSCTRSMMCSMASEVKVTFGRCRHFRYPGSTMGHLHPGAAFIRQGLSRVKHTRGVGNCRTVRDDSRLAWYFSGAIILIYFVIPFPTIVSDV
jgi:hypothetical protein